MGRDIAKISHNLHNFSVSIHAPAWGATGVKQSGIYFGQSFNPRARVGRDVNALITPAMAFCFNPRARVGRDQIGTSWRSKIRQFQSTRPRGARRAFCGAIAFCLIVSIHAPAWGATEEYLDQHTFVVGFNPRARVGRDPEFCDQTLSW